MRKSSLIHSNANERIRASEFSGESAAAQFRAHKKPVRRVDRDRSQAWRHLVQGFFLFLNVSIGLQFMLFVRYFETGGRGIHVSRPPGVEGWLPIAGLMNLKYFLWTGRLPSIHPAAMFLLVAFLSISILFHKAFCSWLCPIGTISEGLWKFGRGVLKRNWTLPRRADLPLRCLKYLLLAFFLYAVAGMPAGSIETFLSSSYGLVADAKMLYFFLHLTGMAALILGALIVLSIFIQNFWCRYLCPYGALMGLAAIFSPARIHRDEARCVACAGCSRACPALLKVDELVCVRSAECTVCLECVAACPAEGALQMVLPRRRKLRPRAVATGLAIVFFGTVGIARWHESWNGRIPDSIYQRLIPHLENLTHP